MLYKTPRCFLPSFKSIGLSVQEKEAINRLSRQQPWQPSWISIGTTLAIFDLQVTWCFLPRPKSIGLLVQKKKRKIDLGFPIGMILGIFFIYKSPWCFLSSFKSINLLVQEKKRKIDFQDGRHGGHLGFRIGMILNIFNLQVIPMVPVEFHVHCSFGLGEQAKNIFFKMAAML